MPAVPPIRRALVTGGAGFIGHHLAHALVRRGVEVTVLDDLSMGRSENVPPGARLVLGDVRDPEAVALAMQGADAVLHEAAIVSIRASLDGFVRDADVNLLGTLNVLQCMADSGVTRALFASSMAVYADSEAPVPLREDALLQPVSPYGIAKLAAERYWLMMCAHAGISGTALRYFNTYGPNQTPTPYVGVITIFINRLLRGELPVVFGDGEQRRDFVHVDDIVAANLAVLDGPPEVTAGRVFNVGTGHATSVNDIARELCALLAPGSEPRRAEAQAGEMRNAIADVSALRETLGWKPSRPTVRFADVVEWWRAHRVEG
jgi:UDP-glucose 4-epimerase